MISVDPKVLGALLSLTGPIEVSGWPTPITAEDAERTLLYQQYQQITDPEQGAQFIADTVQATFDRLEATALPAPARIVETLSPMVQAGRLKLYSGRPEEQALFEEMGVTGAVPEVEGDFFQVVTSNVGQSKIDWFQRRSVSYRAEVDPVTGRVDAVATVTITNQAPASGESDLLIGGTNFPEPGPPGRSRLFVDFYSALDVQAATLDGQPIALVEGQAYGRNLAWTVHTIPAGGSATFEVYLSGLTDPGRYVLDLGMQPVVGPDLVEVTIEPTRRAEAAVGPGLTLRDGVASAELEQLRPSRFAVRFEP